MISQVASDLQIQAASGYGVIPAHATFLVASFITKRTSGVTRPHFVQTSTVVKSIAVKLGQCAFRNVAHDVRWLRVGAGSMPCSSHTLAIVERLIR